MKVLSLTTFIAFLMLGTVFPSQAEVANKIVAVVNQEPITLYEVDKLMAERIDEIKKASGKDRKNKFEDTRQLALQRLIEEKLLDQALEKKQVKVTPEDEEKAFENIMKRNNFTREQLAQEVAKKGLSLDQYRIHLREQLKRVKFMGQVIAPRVKVTDADLDQFFAQYPQEFGKYSSVKMAQIIIPVAYNAGDAELQAAQGQAQEVAQKAKGGSNFEELGRKYGQNPSTAMAAVYQVSQLAPQIGQVISELQPGQVSDPVRSDMGLHVIKLVERSTLAGEEYKAAREQMREKVFEVKLDEEMQKYLDELKETSYIVIK